MRTLTGSSIPNIDAGNLSDYPKGRFKDKISPTATDGTEVSERTLGDIYQGVIELLRLAGITPSEVADKKGASDVANAVGFLKPIGIAIAGYDSGFKIISSSFVTGYSATYASVSWDSALKVAKFKLQILKDGVASTEDLFVTCNPCDGTAVPLHPNIICYAGMASGKFDNDPTSNNFYIVAPGLSGGGDPTEKNFVERQTVSFVIYKI